MNGLRKKKDTPENRAFWENCEAVARKIESWPFWKRDMLRIALDQKDPEKREALLDARCSRWRWTNREGEAVKVYMLTEADFEKLDLLFRMVEAEHKDPVTNVPQSREDLKRVYRYHLYRWIGEVKGDK